MKEYEQLEFLGKGSFGQVYKAKYRGQIAVVKFLNKRKTNLKSFEAEVKILQSLHSRFVLHILGYMDEKDHYTVITEYCPFKTLDAVMGELRKKKKFLTRFGVLKYFSDILNGLSHLSAEHIVHRDLKPENIFITPENVCILADFGLASFYEEYMGRKGNALYQPPEAYFDNRYYQNSEIWSIGLILYELSTNTKIYDHLNGSREKLEEMLRKKDYLPKNYPKHLEPIHKIIDKCLEIDPKKRVTIGELKKEEIMKIYMKEAVDTLFVNDTMDDDIELELKVVRGFTERMLMNKWKDIIGVFRKASRVYIDIQNEYELFELIDRVSVNAGRCLLCDKHSKNEHYIFIKNEKYKDYISEWEDKRYAEIVINTILAIFKFLLKKDFEKEANAIYEGISEDENVDVKYKNKMKRILENNKKISINK